MRWLVGLIVGLMVVTVGVEARVLIQTQCFIRGARVDSSVYNPEAKIATVVLSLLPDPMVQTSRGCFDRTDGRLRATGHGFPPQSATNPAQAEILAKRAAQDTAFMELAECVCGVMVKPEK